jgi:hypothetical protein
MRVTELPANFVNRLPIGTLLLRDLRSIADIHAAPCMSKSHKQTNLIQMSAFTRTFLSIVALVLLISANDGVSAADLPIVLVKESALPYDLSPSNYDNSAANYDNSISNYDNSPDNYDNSEGNYDNSSANYDNGRNGERRLLFKDKGILRFVGYYVMAANGTTNFYSPKGKRMFYNPKKGRGIFGGKDGLFCGVLAQQSGELSLALTERGIKILMLSQ